MALNDEGQQYGNLDEASAIARAPRKCLVIWCGDHKQTPGGLRKTDGAKAFRRKLLRRPIALRGDTEHFQPNMLGKVVLRYLDGMDEPLINSIQVTLRATMGVKTTLERCGPFSLVVLSQRRSQVTPFSGHSDQNASETSSNKLQLNKVQSSLRQTSAKTTQVRSKVKTS